MTEEMTKLADEHHRVLCAIDLARALYPELEARLLAQRDRLHARQVCTVPPEGRDAYLKRLHDLRRMRRLGG